MYTLELCCVHAEIALCTPAAAGAGAQLDDELEWNWSENCIQRDALLTTMRPIS
jgi:hypothetical protein